MSRRTNPSRQIELRQRNEDMTNVFAGVASEHSQLKMKSAWETKTAGRIQRNELFRQMDVVQGRQSDVLAARRQRLTELLIAEKEEQDVMIANLAESDEQRRERLMQQARDLRDQRDQRRSLESTAKKDAIFRAESSLVRDAQSKLKVLRVAADREEQLEQNKARKQQDQDEERFFAEQWADQQSKQSTRTQNDLEVMHRNRQKLRNDLEHQLEATQNRKLQAKAEQQEEDNEFHSTLQKGKDADAAADVARKAARTRLADETKARNADLRQMKEDEKSALAKEEKETLDNLLAQIAKDDASEKQRKNDARKEAMEQIKFVEAQMNTVAENETALDRLWQEENDKEWAKRETRWTNEQGRREALYRDVFNTRKGQINEIRQGETKVAEGRRAEHEAMVVEAKFLASRDTGDVAKVKAKAKSVQDYQSMQMSQRQLEKDTIKEAKRVEMTTSQAVEHQYQAKIAYELQKLETGKPSKYQNVGLAKSNKGISGM